MFSFGDEKYGDVPGRFLIGVKQNLNYPMARFSGKKKINQFH